MSKNKQYVVLPCNGMDKAAGCVTRELALALTEQSGSEIICPVLFHVSDARYKKLAGDHPLLVIDGCPTRCASKLAVEKGLKVANKLTVTEEAKTNGIEIGKSLRLDDEGLRLVKTLTAALLRVDDVGESRQLAVKTIPADVEYEIYQKDKFIFRLPKSGFFFNENDCWVCVNGDTARVGVTDYLQQSASDVSFFNPPALGAKIEQFGTLGDIETSKALVEVVSPVTGKVVAINEALKNAPELINQDPYEKGWLAELKLTDFEKDKELLQDFAGYFPILKRKVDEFHVK